MAEVVYSPNMALPVPIVGVDPGPQFALDLNTCFAILDQHDHSSGSGVPVTPAGININSDLTFNGNDATALRSTQFTAQGSPVSDLKALSVSGVDLYYTDGSGNQIRITASGGVVGTPGSIAGLVPPASATYVPGSSTFVWQSASNTPANMDFASAIFRKLVSGGHGITVSPPSSISSDYALVLPPLPGVKSIMALDASGNITAPYTTDNTTLDINGSNQLEVKALGIGTSQLAALAVTAAKIANSTITATQLANDIILPGNCGCTATFTVATGGPTLRGSGNVGVSGWLSSTEPFSIGQGHAWLDAPNSRTLTVLNNGNTSSYGITTAPFTTYGQLFIAGTLDLTYSGGALTSAAIVGGTGGFTLGAITGSVYQIVLFNNPFFSTPTFQYSAPGGGTLYQAVTTNGAEIGVFNAGTGTIRVDFTAIGERGV